MVVEVGRLLLEVIDSWSIEEMVNSALYSSTKVERSPGMSTEIVKWKLDGIWEADQFTTIYVLLYLNIGNTHVSPAFVKAVRRFASSGHHRLKYACLT
jgi:hypothetical protein